MATHKTIHEYYLQQLENIEQYLKLCLSNADAELIHELRLSIKKLRAFNTLAKQLFAAGLYKSIHLKRRVNELYKLSGQLRDTQVQIYMLASFEESEGIEYPEFRNWLLVREKKRINRFCRNSRHVAPHSIARNARDKTGMMLAKLNDEIVLECTGKVLVDLFEKARKLADGTISETNLHQIRITTKQIRYILNIVQFSYPDFEFNKISVDSLREIEAAAGLWHDNLVRVEYLGKCLRKLNLTENIALLKYHNLETAFNNSLKLAYEEACILVKGALLQ